MEIVTIVGARPQFIKAAAVSRALEMYNRKSRPKRKIREILVHTGQHYDYLMNRVFFEELEIPEPDYNLGVGSGPHGKQTGIMLERVEAVLEKEKPDFVVVYGDTNSTLAGALAASKMNIPIAHVEAGLRSHNRIMPEEINRLLTDHLSTFLFCPTNEAVKNLATEGIKPGREKVVKNVGDVMYDSILHYSRMAETKSTILKDLGLVKLKTHNSKLITPQYYLATLHRAENTDNPKKLKSIFGAFEKIGETIPVILPLHPRTRKMMNIDHFLLDPSKVKLIDPVSYLNMLALEKNAKAILTDSGGVQKEAYWFRVPCFTLREETEWVETLRDGRNMLVGTESQKVVKVVNRLKRRKMINKRTNLFGDGKAGEKIIQLLVSHS
jgi:UDP-N-acetylglucosamine 2-epimerase